jgi:hypothetical protein
MSLAGIVGDISGWDIRRGLQLEQWETPLAGIVEDTSSWNSGRHFLLE